MINQNTCKLTQTPTIKKKLTEEDGASMYVCIQHMCTCIYTYMYMYVHVLQHTPQIESTRMYMHACAFTRVCWKFRLGY
jgi:hypothetical protein